jgi:hypothetical protein
VSLHDGEQETALTSHTVLDDDDMHHLVNGLSLEVVRQAERIRRRSHGQDWPAAASAMAELQEAVDVLDRIMNLTLRNALRPPAPEPDEGPAPLPEPPTGQYL